MSCVSVVTLLNDSKEFIPLIIENFKNFQYEDKLELVIVDDSEESSINKFLDIPDCLYLHLKKGEKEEFMKQIIEGYKQPNKSFLYYQKKRNKLPDGFKRDYGCGFSSHPYIFHMNADCVYHPKTIERKMRFMKRTGAECIYCDKMLCYDIYGKELYKTESPNKIYEATLFHTQEFWKRRGFQWSDIMNEGKYFHYNNGQDRKMDNYYDTIQLLSILNMNLYSPVKITLENVEIKIPECVDSITIKDHPMNKLIDELYSSAEILGINSEFLENIVLEDHKITKITEKWKQPKLAGIVKKFEKEFNCLVYGSKYPAWALFEKISFDIILLETMKNREQMDTIIKSCKNTEYIEIEGMYINKDFLDMDEKII